MLGGRSLQQAMTGAAPPSLWATASWPTQREATATSGAPLRITLRRAIELTDGLLSRGLLTPAQQSLVVGDANFYPSIQFASTLAGQTIHLSTADDTLFGPTALLVSSNVTLAGPAGSQGVTIAGP